MEIDLAKLLTEGSKQTYHPKDATLDEYEDFTFNSEFKAFEEAYNSWIALDEWLLSESRFFSLMHLLEAKCDLDAAIDLLSKFYYRQSFATLRTYLEDTILPLYFFHFPDEYTKWKTGSYRTPNIRSKKNGVLDKIRSVGTENPQRINQFDEAYQKLSRSVHGQPEALIHTGVESEDWRGHSYRRSSCIDWLKTAREVLQAGIAITKELEDLWMERRQNMGNLCSVCHSLDFEKAAAYELPERTIFECRCLKCGNTWHISR